MRRFLQGENLMNTQPTTKPSSVRLLNHASGIRIGVLLSLVALIGVSLLSVSSASLRGPDSNKTVKRATDVGRSESRTKSALLRANVGLSFDLLFPQQPPPPPSIATKDGTGGNCGAAKAEFQLGDQVCAEVTSTGGAASRRRITWQDPEGFVRQSTPITSDPQSDNFAIPGTGTSTLSNGQVVNNIGKWRVSLVGRSLVTYAVFVVK